MACTMMLTLHWVLFSPAGVARHSTASDSSAGSVRGFLLLEAAMPAVPIAQHYLLLSLSVSAGIYLKKEMFKAVKCMHGYFCFAIVVQNGACLNALFDCAPYLLK